MRKYRIVGAIVVAALMLLGVIALRTDPHLGPELPPNEVSAKKLSNDGVSLSQQGEYEKAIAAFTQAIELDPANPEHYFLRALTHNDEQKYDKALADYDSALERSYSSRITALGRVNKARVFIRLERRDAALAEFDQALAAMPEDPEILNYRAMLKFFMEDFTGAKTDYTAALKVKPDHANAHHGLGVTYYAERDWAKSAEHLVQARALAKGNADTAMWAILAYKRNGKAAAPAEFDDIDQNKWPGQTVAFLLGQKDILDNYIESATARNDPQTPEFICASSFVSLSLIQIENRVEQVSKEYAKTGKEASFLDDTYKTFEKCPLNIVDGIVGRKEIEFLKAQ